MGALLVLSWNSVGWWLALLPGVVLAWVLLRHVLPTLLGRFDGRALSVTPPPGADLPPARPLDAAQHAVWAGLAAWCHAGTGDGRRPWWRPGARARIDEPLTVARLAGGTAQQRLALAEAFSRELDGSHQLSAAGGRWAGLLLRLRVKWHDLQWWRARQPTDPWDCGYLGGSPGAREALRFFRPRRATLLVAAGLPGEAVAEARTWLAAHAGGFAHPVRLLVLAPAEPTGPATVIRLDPP